MSESHLNFTEQGEICAGADPYLCAQIEEYLTQLRQEMENMSPQQCRNSLSSEYNYQQRRKLPSSQYLGIYVQQGDICYTDFGRTYIQEAGYQHFGLVMAVTSGKVFTVPMTSNAQAYAKAYDEQINPEGRFNLMRIGLIPGLNKLSTLFLNDGKYINSARIISVQAHIDCDSELFIAIQKRLLRCLQLE